MRGSEEKGYGAEEPLLQWRSYLQHGLAGPLIGHDWCSASHDLKPVSLNKWKSSPPYHYTIAYLLYSISTWYIESCKLFHMYSLKIKCTIKNISHVHILQHTNVAECLFLFKYIAIYFIFIYYTALQHAYQCTSLFEVLQLLCRCMLRACQHLVLTATNLSK